MNAFELELELIQLNEVFPVDFDVINYLINDIYHSKRFFIIDIESDEPYSIDFYQKLQENKHVDVTLITSTNEFPSDCCEDDCILVISNSGDNYQTVNFVKTAKSNGSYIYLISSNSNSELASLSDDYIHIYPNSFEEHVKLYLKSVLNGVIFFNSQIDDYLDKELSGPQPLNILAPLEREEKMREHSHFRAQKVFSSGNRMLMLAIICIILMGSYMLWDLNEIKYFFIALWICAIGVYII